MAGFENHIGFTISGSKLQVVEIIYKDRQFILNKVDEAYFNEPVSLENDKETKIDSLLQGAFNEILIKKPFKSSFASFTLPFDLFHIMQVPYDNTLLHQDIVEELRWEFSVLYPYISTKDLVIQYIEVEKNNLINQNTMIAIAIHRKYLQMIHNFCMANNLKLKFVDNIHTASERALAANYPAATKGLTMSIYIANKFLSLIHSLDGKPVYFKVIPLNDAGEIPSLLLNETTLHESYPDEEGILTEFYPRINRNAIDNAFISGEEISESMIKTLSSTLGMDLIYFNPFEKIKPDSELYTNKFYLEKNNSFSPAAGIAYRLA
jgi:Tfp pilus assembly PilM family ATPase